MNVLAVMCGCVALMVVLVDAFQTIILPRRPVGRLRITRLFFLVTWIPWKWVARRLPRMTRGKAKPRELMYSVYGPSTLLMLFGVWAVMLIAAYTLIFFGMHMPFSDPLLGVEHVPTSFERLRTCFYVSGTNLFTLGLGDVQPTTPAARMLIVLEAGTGLGFVALVIGYVPVLYGAFSAREIAVALLDARAGSPPTAGELLARHNFNGGHHALTTLLAEWERWCAELLETHISYPILCYYRSQHDNQSWISALTAVLDTCALLITTVEGPSTRQAQLTFAIGRHTLLDLGHVFHREAEERRLRDAPLTRMPDEEFARLCDLLGEAGFKLCGELDVRERLLAIRRLYEPHAIAMAEYLGLELPGWAPSVEAVKKHDAWATVASLRSAAALADRLSSHVSVRSAASHLHDDEAHPL